METEEYEPSGAFEAIKVLGRELQLSKERTKQLEAELAKVCNLSLALSISEFVVSDGNGDTQSKSVAPEAEKQLLTRAANAEARVNELDQELKANKAARVRLESRVETLQTQVNGLQCVKQVRELNCSTFLVLLLTKVSP